LNPYLLGGIALGIAMVSGTVGYKVASSHYIGIQNEERQRVIEDQQIAAKAYADLLEQANKYSAELEVKNEANKVIAKQLAVKKTKIITRTVYSNVCVDADGVQLINSALRGSGSASSASEPSNKVPK